MQETVTSQIDAALSHVGRTLPPVAGALAGPLSSGLAHLAGNEISRFMASPVFERLWVTANRFTHSQLISVLNGNNALVATIGGQVVLKWSRWSTTCCGASPAAWRPCPGAPSPCRPSAPSPPLRAAMPSPA